MVFFLPFVTWDQSMKLSGTLCDLFCFEPCNRQKCLIMMAANNFSVR